MQVDDESLAKKSGASKQKKIDKKKKKESETKEKEKSIEQME